MGCSCIYRDGCADEAVWLQYGLRRAGKEYKCECCGRTIAKGEKFHLNQYYWADDGPKSLRSLGMCLGCHLLVKHFFCDGWSYSRVFEDIAEHLTAGKNPPDLCCLDGLPPEAVEVFDKHVLPLLGGDEAEAA